MMAVVVFVCLLLVTSACGKTAEEWKSRVIYQLLTDRLAQDSDPTTPCTDLNDYCGGTFQGIVRKLDYIQGMGFNAIWISPIPKQTPHDYHGYAQEDIYEVNPHFGSSDDLHKLVTESHNRGIWVMLDVVANHMGIQRYGDWNNFTFYTPFNQKEYYHSYCLITNYNNQTEVEICRLDNLPDLDQSNSFVRSTLKSWINNIVSTYGIDGLRIDTVPEVPKDFWEEYAEAAGVYQVGEVFNGDPTYVAGYQGPLDALLNYPMFYKLRNAFQYKQTMRNIHDGVEANLAANFSDVSVLGNFLDNHDNDRFLHNNDDWSVLKNALAYVIFAEGIPIVYYGTEQAFNGYLDKSDPGGNRESLWPHYDNNSLLYQYIGTIVKFRVQEGSSVYEQKQIERYVDDQFFAFTRGYVFVATTNIGSGQSLSRTITYHPYTDGTKLVNLLDKSDIVTVSGGSFPVNIENGQPKIYHPEPSEWENPAVPGADDEGGVHHGEGEEPSEWENPAVPGADDEGGVHHGEGEWENPAVPGADDEGGVHHGEGPGVMSSIAASLVVVGLLVAVAINVFVVWKRRRYLVPYQGYSKI